MVRCAAVLPPQELKSAIVRDPLITSPDTTVIDAIAQMSALSDRDSLLEAADEPWEDRHRTMRSSCVLVVTEKQVVGLLTERDVVRLVSQRQSLDSLSISQVMLSPVKTLRESAFTDCVSVMSLLRRYPTRPLPILDEQDCLVGIVTAESLQQVINAQLIEAELPESQSVRKDYPAGLMAALPVGMFRTDATGSCLDVNESYCRITGLTPDAAKGNGWQQGLHPDDRDQVVAAWEAYIRENTSFHLEYRFQHPDGTVAWVYGQAIEIQATNGQILGYAGTLTDISERKSAEAQLNVKNTVLAKIANDDALSEVLTTLIEAMEQRLPGALCSVCLLDEHNRLHLGAAPSLPLGYLQAIDGDGVLIGDEVGSCGTAAFRQETIIVSDIATDRLWQDYKDVVLRYGLRACWSSPIMTSDSQVLGTFAVYYRTVRRPQPDELEAMTQMVDIAGAAIKHEQAKVALQNSEARWQFALEGAGHGVWDWNVQTDIVSSSRQSKAMLGYAEHELGNHIEDWDSRVHPEDKAQCYADFALHVKDETPIFQNEHRIRCKDGSYKWILDRGKVIEWTADGQPLRIIGTQTDISERKQAEAQLKNLIAGTAATTGRDFFTALVKHIGEALNVAYAIVTEESDGILHTLAIWANGSLQPLFSYALAQTPCGQALQDGRLYCEASVQQQFPDCVELVEMEAESYLGIALHDAQGQAIGNLCIYDKKPLQDPQRTEQILRVFAARAAAELERQRALTRLEQLNQSLESQVMERTATLQEREQFLQTVLDAFPLSVFWKNQDSVYLGCNRQFLQSTGCSSAAEIVGRTDYELPWRISEAEAYRDDDQQVMASNLAKLGIIETQMQADGSQLWIETNKVPLRNLKGEVIGILGTYQDISERQRAELALQQSSQKLAEWRERYDIAAWASGQVLFEYDLETERDTWGPNIEAVLGIRADALHQNTQALLTCIHPEDRATFQHVLDNDQTAKTPYQIEFRYRIPDGNYLWIEERGMTRYDAQGNAIQVIGYWRNISERKAAEKALKMTQSAVDLAGEGVFWIRPDSSFYYVNEAACFMSGYSQEELLTLSVPDIDYEFSPDRWIEHWQDIQQQRNFTIESQHRAKDGRIYPVEISINYLNLDGEEYNFASVRDISVRKQTELALQGKTEELDRFFSLALDLLCIVSIDGYFLRLNLQWEKSLEYLLSELEGAKFIDYVHPDDVDSTLQVFAQAQAGEEILNFVNRYRCRDGSYRWIEWRSVTHKHLIYAAARDITERRQIEQTSRLLASVVESSEDAIITYNTDRLITSWNRGAENVFGYSIAEIMDQPIDTLIPLERINKSTQVFERLRQGGRIEAFETVRLRKDQTAVEVSITVSPLKDKTGQVVGVSKIIRDISERKQVEAERLRAEKNRKALELLEQIIDNVLAGYWDWDIPNHQEYLSPGFKAMFGYEDHELPNTPETWQSLIFPEDLPSVRRCFERHVQNRGESPYYNEVRYRHKDGSTVWVIRSGQVIEWDEVGAPMRMIGCHIDISDRKRAEAAVQQESSFRKQILENMAEGLCVYHNVETFPFLYFTVWNQQMQMITGYTQAEINHLGWHQSLFRHPDIQEQMSVCMERLHQGDSLMLEEWDIQRKDGQLRTIAISTSALLSTDGRKYVLALIQDITERKQAEAKLRQANKELTRATRLKDEFLANMSHELRTPLNAILGMAEGLQGQVFGRINSEQIEALQTIERSGLHLLALINDILDVAKIESGQMTLAKASVSAAMLCQSSANFIQQSAQKKDIQVEVNLCHPLPYLHVDERRIRQVLLNLLDNAVKFTPTGGRITLEASLGSFRREKPNGTPLLPQAFLQIAVTDTGIGIAPDRIDRLFQPFVQIDSALNRKYAGTGLGLALVKRIVELHGGQVRVISEVGRGSCFTINLPCTATALSSAAASARPPMSAQLRSLNRATAPVILLAEDNEASIKTISRYLIAKGYRLLLAHDGQEAVDLAQTEKPDLILMDIQMPGMDGLEAIQRLRRDLDLNQLPIIALTALAMPGDRERCIAAGANEYLSKPIKLQRLLATIQHHLIADNADS